MRTLTWDQGKEMAEHAQFSIDTGVDVYFCDPHSPWQRGTVENTNGLFRQYFPRGGDYSTLDEADLDIVAYELNNRPRKNPRLSNARRSLQPSPTCNDHLTSATFLDSCSGPSGTI